MDKKTRGRKRKVRNACETRDGGYMEAKRSKLDGQFKEEIRSNGECIFSGVAIFVNGYTEPSSNDLKKLMQENGGIFHQYYIPSKTTHIIASNLPNSKIKSSKTEFTVTSKWILDSLDAGHLLNYTKYLLYSSQLQNQPKLTFKEDTNSCMECDQNVEEEVRCSEEYITSDKEEETKNCSVSNLLNSDEREAPKDKEKSSEFRSTFKGIPTKDINISTANPNFLTEFYGNSRLHHISAASATFKQYVKDLQKKEKLYPGRMILKERKENNSNVDYSQFENVVTHIDMDCFFVSVGLRKHPELRGSPVAVTHAKSNSEKADSKSEVACCSYEARQKGVKNGMYLGTAREFCPQLRTISYDFKAYEEVSYILYDTIASYTHQIEAVSCDEMYVALGDICSDCAITPLDLVTHLRDQIQEKTKCSCSAGIGPNLLIARLATKLAKPDAQYFVQENNLKSFMDAQLITSLPGVGSNLSKKLTSLFDVESCGELTTIPLGRLQDEFGQFKGKMLFNSARGICKKELNVEHERKCVSSEVNYGIRFQCQNEAKKFLRELSEEVSRRLAHCGLKGKQISLKLKVRSEGAPSESAKFMGHGFCNNITKTAKLLSFLSHQDDIYREVVLLFNQVKCDPKELRGVGIQITKLQEISSTSKEQGIQCYLVNKTKVSSTIPCQGSTSRNVSQNSSDFDRPILQTIPDAFPQASSHQIESKIAKTNVIDLEVLNSLPEELRKDVIAEYKSLGYQMPILASEKLTFPPNKISVPESSKGKLRKRGRRKGKNIHSPSVKFTLEQRNVNENSGEKRIISSASISEDVDLNVNCDSSNSDTFSQRKLPINSSSEIPNLCGISELVKVKSLLKDWLTCSSLSSNDDDILFISNYCKDLIGDGDLESLIIVLKLIKRSVKLEDPHWRNVFCKIDSLIQSEMMSKFGTKLKYLKDEV